MPKRRSRHFAERLFGAFDAADDGALHADGAGGFDVHQVVVEEEDAGGVAAERTDDVLEGVGVRLDLAGEVRNEAMLEQSAEPELVDDAIPVQRVAVRKQRTRDVTGDARDQLGRAGIETARPAGERFEEQCGLDAELQLRDEISSKLVGVAAPGLECTYGRRLQPPVPQLAPASSDPRPSRARSRRR